MTEKWHLSQEVNGRLKNLDLLVLNEISEANPAFGSDENQVYLVRPDGVQRLDKTSKARIAALVWDDIIALAGRA